METARPESDNDSVGIVFKTLRPLVNRVLPDHPMAVTVLAGPGRGLRLMIEPRVEKYYWRGGHEPAVARVLTERLKPGDIFWDVGAHIGYFALIASRLVGANGRVHAFEPLPANAERLRQSIRLSRAKNVSVHQLAVSDHQEEVFLRPADSTLMWSIAREPGIGLRIASTTLNAMLAEHGEPTLVKIDVEGAEIDVLRGATELLKRRRVFVIEILSEEARANIAALYPRYSIERLDAKNGLMHPH